MMAPRISKDTEPPPRNSSQIAAVAILNVSENPEHALWAIEDAQNSPLKPIPPAGETRSHQQISVFDWQGFKCTGTKQIEYPVSEAWPAWRGEIRAPTQDEALSSALSGRGGGLRNGVIVCLLVAALGLGWVGASNPYSFFKSDPGGQIQPTALPDRATLAVGEQAASGPLNNSPASTPAHSEPTHPPNQEVVRREGTVPPSPQKITALKQSTAVPLPSGKNVRHSLTPTPDTRPNTIQGWKVKHVSGGTVVLQGPDGVHKASVGDTVPGAGRIDSIVRWGGRLLVATSKGLITTD
jgi:hypothetical protein